MDGLNFCGSLRIVCGHASERGFCTLNRCPVVLEEFQTIYREALAREIHTLPVPEGVPAISKEDGGTWKT